MTDSNPAYVDTDESASGTGVVEGVSVVINTPSASPTNAVPVLRDINLSIKRGSLTAIVGPVGSGKSSFCNAILGEMHKTKGRVSVTDSTAYAAQSPWILNATGKQVLVVYAMCVARCC
jgi:ABC-type transport system involved in cytochrome bd biosynthesis fused ATPase/permease subunit